MSESNDKALHARIRLDSSAYENPDALYLLTVWTYERQPLFLEDAPAGDMVRLLARLRNQRRTRIFAYCLMPDHLHLLLSPAPGDGVSKVIQS